MTEGFFATIGEVFTLGLEDLTAFALEFAIAVSELFLTGAAWATVLLLRGGGILGHLSCRIPTLGVLSCLHVVGTERWVVVVVLWGGLSETATQNSPERHNMEI